MFGVGSLGAAVGRPLARERVVSSARRGPAPGSTGSTSNAASARTGVVARVSSSRRASVSPSPTPGGSSRLSPLRASGDDDVAAAAAPPTSELEGIREVLAGVRAELTSTSSDPKRKKSALTFAVALVALVAIHLRDPGWGVWNNIRIAGSLLLGAGLALKGLRGGSLDVTGACGAALVGWGTLYAGVRFGVALGVFFFASSAMTRVGAAVKARIDEHHVEGKEGGARNWIQVAANGAVPTFLAMGYARSPPEAPSTSSGSTTPSRPHSRWRSSDTTRAAAGTRGEASSGCCREPRRGSSPTSRRRSNRGPTGG